MTCPLRRLLVYRKQRRGGSFGGYLGLIILLVTFAIITSRAPNTVLDILLRIVHSLNAYANLVLVLITAVYAWLTWHSLRAFRESTLRDREALHLQEVKESVIQPIVSWINGTVMERFTGKSPELLRISGGYAGNLWQLCHTVDDPFVGRSRLNVPHDPPVPDPLATWSSTESGRISKFLYDHTKQAHFRRELHEFHNLLEEVSQLTGSILSVANESAKDIASSEIPQARRSDDENSMPEWTNTHLLAAVCIESLLLGATCAKTELRSGTGFHLLVTTRNEALARAIQPDKLRHWSELGFEKVRRRWEAHNLPSRVQNLLKNAAAVQNNVHQLMFTHSLGVDCELVSGKTRRR